MRVVDDAGSFEDEFDTETSWIGQALTEIPPARRLAGACRGSGPPSAFGWLADRLGVGPSDRVVDLGGGLGGPAAWLRDRTGASTVIAEAVTGGVTWAGRLFGVPGVVAGDTLPFRSGSLSAGWSLATLSTVPDLDGMLAELRRVLRPGAVLGVQDHVRLVRRLQDPPSGNRFLSPDELLAALDAAGFPVIDRHWADVLPVADDAWSAGLEAVESIVDVRHPDADVRRRAERTKARFGELEAEGSLRSLLLVAERRP